MNQSDYLKSRVAQGFSTIVIIGSIILALKLAKTNPVAVWILIIALIIVGLFSLVGGLIVHDRYHDVFDYEPATFLGRPSNGKQIRSILMVIIYFGVWLIIIGGILFLLMHAGLLGI